MKYKIGDRVKIKSWEELVDEFGIYDGYIYGIPHLLWHKCMDEKLPINREIIINDIIECERYVCNIKNDTFYFTKEMIKEKVGNMKRYVRKVEEEVTDKITPFCGFVDSDNRKGYLVNIDECNLKAIPFEEAWEGVPNRCYGKSTDNIFNSVEEFVKNGLIKCCNSITVKEYYFGNSLRDLHMWLLEE